MIKHEVETVRELKGICGNCGEHQMIYADLKDTKATWRGEKLLMASTCIRCNNIVTAVGIPTDYSVGNYENPKLSFSMRVKKIKPADKGAV